MKKLIDWALFMVAVLAMLFAFGEAVRLHSLEKALHDRIQYEDNGCQGRYQGSDS